MDYKGRLRNKIIAFRVSKQESELIDNCVKLSGLTKQEYITKKLLNRDVVVQGNPRVYKALRNKMLEIYEQLKKLEQCNDISDEFLYTLQVIAEILNGLKGEK